LDGQAEQKPFSETYDYVIVGSGASGATAARVLAESGASVAILEEGPAVWTNQFSNLTANTFQRLLREQGAQVALGRSMMTILQGRCLGGSTVINAGICWRIPDDVWEPWNSVFGLGEALPLDQLHTHWDQIESELSVESTPPELWGNNNRLMDEARGKLGLAGAPIRRNADGCQGSGRCFNGCPHGAKQSMLVSYLPYAAERGANLITSARVDRVLTKNRRAVGVRGYFHDPYTHRNLAPFTVFVRKAVLVGASAIQTPLLLARSGVRSPHLGKHLQGHPGIPMVGIFDAPVNMWFGATQGYDIFEHRTDGKFKIETISLPPELLFAQMYGVGQEWVQQMAQAENAAVWAVHLRAETQGLVTQGLLGPAVYFELTQADIAHLRVAMGLLAELFFVAGARYVLPGIFGVPAQLDSPDQKRLIEEGPCDPASYNFTISHMFGTARMSVRPADGVVGPDFAVHGLENLYVIDSSVFPTNLGVNPQIAIMGIAMHAARQIGEKG
jgi:choline dehydrogenase-like flavoprotein